MPLPTDLLAQARHLAARGQGRPRQADLRRAVSAAYYALFHFLIDEACRELVGGAAVDRALRDVLARAFIHGAMRETSQRFQTGQLPVTWQPLFPGSIANDLRTIAETFVAAQEERHQADYDRSAHFIRPDVIAVADRVEHAMQLWANVTGTSHGRLYLLCLLAWKQLQGR